MNQNLKQELRSIKIVHFALMIGAFFFIVGFMLFGSYLFLFEAIAGLVLLGFFFPTNFRIAKEIKHDLREIY